MSKGQLARAGKIRPLKRESGTDIQHLARAGPNCRRAKDVRSGKQTRVQFLLADDKSPPGLAEQFRQLGCRRWWWSASRHTCDDDEQNAATGELTVLLDGGRIRRLLGPAHGVSILLQLDPRLLARQPRRLGRFPQRMFLLPLLDRPIPHLGRDAVRLAAAKGVQTRADEERDEVVDRDVSRGGEEDRMRDAEMKLEERDQRDDRLRLARPRWLFSDASSAQQQANESERERTPWIKLSLSPSAIAIALV